MIKRCLVVVVRNRESMMHPHGRLVVEHRVDWRGVLHGDETSPGRIEERHLPVRGGEQVPAADPGQDCRGVRCVLALTLTKNLANSPSSD